MDEKPRTKLTRKQVRQHPEHRKMGSAAKIKPEHIATTRRLAKQKKFLAEFVKLGHVGKSAKLAGVSRALVYWWRDTYPSFANELTLAIDEAFGVIEKQP